MKYYHRKTGAQVDAIQFTGPESVERIAREFACYIEYKPDEAMLIADGTQVKRGQYAVLGMCAIVAMNQEWFDGRFKKNEFQRELFPKRAERKNR
jgi:hypothetical protein